MSDIQDGYYIEPLTSKEKNYEEIQEFSIDREADYRSMDDVVGLEAYLKRAAWENDLSGSTKVYLIKDSTNDMIAAYFGLKAGMVGLNQDSFLSNSDRDALRAKGIKPIPYIVPGIEVSHLAVNDEYRRFISRGDKLVGGLGDYFFQQFVMPIVFDVRKKVGVQMIYLYAAGDDNLVRLYRDVYKFSTVGDEELPLAPLQPDYDYKCTFMYRMIG